MKKLDFGCGQSKLPDHIGLDIYEGENIDIVHNFDVFPYPFEDNTFDEIRCWSSLEHVNDLMLSVAELHRIAKPDALIKVLVPHYSGPDAYRDPTHKIFFSYVTFDYFCERTTYKSKYNGLLKIEKRMFGIPENTGIVTTIFKSIFNRIPNLYERYLCWIFPTKTMYFELRVIK